MAAAIGRTAAETMASRCTEWRREDRQECTQERDEGYNACSDYESRCCDWWPCSWACKVVSWFCVAWTWISNVVCVAWAYITEWVCVAWEVVTVVISAVAEVIFSTIGFLLDAIAFVIQLFTLIPIIGRFIDLVLKAIAVVISFVVGLLDRFLTLIGIRPEKKLRVLGLILRDEAGNQVIPTANAIELLDAAADILKREANIRLMRAAPFQFSTPFGDREHPNEDWVKVVGPNQDSTTLDVPCGASGFAQNLGIAGSELDAIVAVNMFYGTFRRLIGLGGPLACLFIRHMPDDGDACGPWGCCLVIAGYITVRAQPCDGDSGRNWRVVAHEIGHTGLLLHRSASDEPDNLMATPYASPAARDDAWMAHLTRWQQSAVRTSRFVTYL